MRRHPSNPIVTAAMSGPGAVLTFNPGVTWFGGRWLMAHRVDMGVWEDPNIVGTDIAFAESADGVTWTPLPHARLDRLAACRMLQPLEPHRDLEHEIWRAYDPRLVTVTDDAGELLLLTFAVDTTHGLRAGIARSRDGMEWSAVSLGAPDNRNQVLFPGAVGEAWMRLERPMHDYGGEAMNAQRYGIWISSSPDLAHWGHTRFVCDRSVFPWANDKVGPGAPPIRTEAGWLCIVHGVSIDPSARKRGWEPVWQKRYSAGAMLLDLDDPSRVIAAAQRPLLAPSEIVSYEANGFRHDVVFPCGAVIVMSDEGEELRVYYGAADTTIAMASAPLSQVIDFVLAG